MNILFKNSYTKNQELLKEIYSYYFLRRPFAMILNTLACVLLLKTIIEWFINDFLNLPVIFLLIFYFILRYFSYKNIISRQIKADLELNKGEPLKVKTIVTEEMIQYTASNGAINEVTYDNLKKWFQTKNLILILSKANLINIFQKDTFEEKNADEFISFIESKGIKKM